MQTIASFSVDHRTLLPGLYVSRRDSWNDCEVTTFDLRFTAPNREPVIQTPALHTIEHMGATFLRNSERKNEVVYFGPMGCRTGFYLLMFGHLEPSDVIPLVKDMCDFIMTYSGEVPGARPEQCGNYLEHDLNAAKRYVEKYKAALR